MTPQEWSSAANKMSRANPGLSRAEIITRMNLKGMPRPTGIKNKGTTANGRPVFGPKTRSQGQLDRRRNHEKTSTTESADYLKQLKEQQATMNNMAAHARSIGLDVDDTNLEHAYPSDQSEPIGDRGLPGDYTYLNSNSEAAWKTSVEQYNRTHGGKRYRLIPRQEGYRIVDTRYADHLGESDLPGMDVDESMSPEQIFTALPFMVRQDLSMRQTQFPGIQPIPQLKRTPQQTGYKKPLLPGFTGVERQPSVTAASTPYSPPSVMSSKSKNGNGSENGNGNGNGNGGYSNGSGNGNGGNGNGNGFVDGLTSTASLAAGTAIAIGGGIISIFDLLPRSAL
tara:strand:- start:51 stop:1067 length:1017 start_codon:yes stop_codon:yes gene_type:complete